MKPYRSRKAKLMGRPSKDPLIQYSKLHAAITEEKTRIEARLREINKAMGEM